MCIKLRILHVSLFNDGINRFVKADCVDSLILRLYAEAKKFEKEINLRNKIDLSQCTNLNTRIVGSYDPDYSGKVIAESDAILN